MDPKVPAQYKWMGSRMTIKICKSNIEGGSRNIVYKIYSLKTFKYSIGHNCSPNRTASHTSYGSMHLQCSDSINKKLIIYVNKIDTSVSMVKGRVHYFKSNSLSFPTEKQDSFILGW